MGMSFAPWVRRAGFSCLDRSPPPFGHIGCFLLNCPLALILPETPEDFCGITSGALVCARHRSKPPRLIAATRTRGGFVLRCSDPLLHACVLGPSRLKFLSDSTAPVPDISQSSACAHHRYSRCRQAITSRIPHVPVDLRIRTWPSYIRDGRNGSLRTCSS